VNRKPPETADTLLADALRLTTSLDTLIAEDRLLEKLAPAIVQGGDRLAELQHRSAAASMNAEDAALLQTMLDKIRARLRFLEGLEQRDKKHRIRF
jgi:hypothetical protein